MLNPNVPEAVSNYERIEKTLAYLIPDPRNFEGRIYPPEDVGSDIKQLDDLKNTPGYKKSEERSDAKILEQTFTDMVERGDWFGDFELYSDDEEFLALKTFPTAEIDDVFNHIDVIGMANNGITGHETVPFAIDLTYNTDDDKMTQKFRWKHVYGKKDTAPEGVSEFGNSYMDKDRHGKDILKTRPLQMKFRYGLKIPGFASAKYFEDKDDIWNPMHEKGRIDVMPRFIIGYSTDIADTLSSGPPTGEYRRRYGEQVYQQKRKEYENAELRAKWCTLFECHKQASDIRFMIEHMDNEETKWMYPKELEKAKKQIAALDIYFTKAIELATEKIQTNPDEMAAMKYADRDIVCQAIMRHSDDTYIAKSWK